MTVEAMSSAALLVGAYDSGPYATRGSATSIGMVTTVAVGTERAVRSTSGYLTVSGVPSLSGDDFTVEAWIRVSKGGRARPVWSRLNGETELSLTVLADGTPRFYASSAQGGYRLTLNGTNRLDDGLWHHIAVRAEYGWFGVITFSLWVDGVLSRPGTISPGLFAARPNFDMTTAIGVGGRDGATMNGDVLAVAWHTQPLADGVLAARWGARPGNTSSQVGWGIIL
ncbi:LamG domain-containing protein [uncultured Corynebacterium sp.]|uniref:LamG domain-containing protein n=1 Tax=uncultured Corynebacterium sp. TaxID=159447 RepID=UPI00260D4408|nr:LamG domain-containing protein [uncultured Corynebacterium sp.]